MAEVEHSSITDSEESEVSSHTSSVLSLRYSSSPFASQSNTSDSEEDSHRVEPYLYEPEQSSSDDAHDSLDDDGRTERLGNTDW